MKKYSKLIAGTILAAGLALPLQAHAQSYDGAYSGAEFSQMGQFDMRASVGFKIPLGATNKSKVSDQARFGFGLSVTNTRTDLRTGQQSWNERSLLNVGFYESETPSLQFNNVELYGPSSPIFQADEADESGDPEKDYDSAKTALLVVAGVTVVAVGGLLYSLNEELEDTFNLD